MAQNTDLNVSPYYDDYDETNDFHRILFRPSNAIQARELTQLQSIIQNQVEKFGNHVFKEGSLVMGGTVTVNKEYYAVKMLDGNPNGSGVSGAETYRVAAVGKYYQGKESKVVGKCINTAATTTDGDPLTLFFNIVQSGNPSGTTFYSTFEDSEEIEEVSVSADGTYSNASNSDNEFRAITTNATSTGSAATVRSGIFYTRGFFARCAEQTILLDKYSNTPTYRIGLQIEETLISSADPGYEHLDDNATGTSNENAPGANRLKITLTFTKKAIGGTQDVDNFIELSRVEAGIITKQKDVSVYNVLERTLARRTFDESGDYITKPFEVQLRQHLNSGTNNGVYLSTNTVTPGDKTKFVGVISPGKAYVKGFEIDKPSENLVTISKARTTEDAGALAVPFEIGNYYNVINAYSQPDFGTGDSDITAFGPVELTDTVTSTPKDKAGTTIGRARVRYFNCVTPTVGSGVHTAASVHRIYLFDVRMYTKLTVASTSYALTAGQRVKGSSSGAKGTIAEDVGASGTTAMLIDVEGTFTTSDTLRLEKDTSGGKAVSAVKSYSTDRVRQIYQTYSATAGAGSKVSGAANFTCDPVTTDNQFTITGTVKATGTALTGVNSTFTQELKEGDVIVAPSGEPEVVASITSDTAAVISSIGTASEGKFIRQRAQLQEQEKTVAIAATPKNFVSSLTPNSMTIRKQATETLNGSGAGTIGGVTGEVLTAEPTTNAGDYSIAIMEDNTGGDANEGKLIDITQHASVIESAAGGGGAISLSSTNSTAMDVSDQVKVIYAAVKDSSGGNAAKTIHRARGVAVTTPSSEGSQSTVYGTNYNDELITLGVPDVLAIRAIFESNDTTGAIPNKLTLASGFGASKPGQKLTGSVSGAVGRVIEHDASNNVIYFYYNSKSNFTTADTITNEHNTDTTTNSRVCSAVTIDSKDISRNFLLDRGQRDGYYGLASIKRRPGVPAPQNPIVVIFDYFKSAGGSFHTVNSYSGNADSGGPALQYENVPKYVANIFDPLGLEGDGKFELSDAVDFRSYVHSLHDPNAAFDVSSITDVSAITVQPFNYTTEQFSGNRAVTFDLPKSATSLSTSAMSHYLPRIDKLSLSSGGQFLVTNGEAAEHPRAPIIPSNSILLHTLYIQPFTQTLGKISVISHDHKRFTMRDIGKIQGRVKTLERVTSLNALEQETNLHNIKDADGLDRFKSGFVTDNFRGHRTGNVLFPDYKVGVDRATGTLRPQHKTRFFNISLNADKSSGYQKTGDLITLPYTEVEFISIDKASTTEFVNPYNIVIFNGTVTLSPSKDLWFSEKRLPGIRRVVMGDYDSVLAGAENALGNIWNNWQSDWLGEPTSVTVSRDITTAAEAESYGILGDDAGTTGGDNNCNWWDDSMCEDEF
jgi:hypothetical protein